MNRFPKFISLLVFVILFMSYQGKAQTSEPVIESVSILSPSANAAALGRYGDIPVSNYTGAMGFDIPIHVLTYAGVEVPISLSYHGGGVRVEDEASWTGLNWSLNAGAVITKNIRGLDDFPEFSQTFLGTTPSSGRGFFKEAPMPPYVEGSAHTQGAYTFVSGWENDNTPLPGYLTQLWYNHLDGMPDIMNVNLMGRSYKFVIDKPRNDSEDYHIVVYGQDDVRIELVNNDLTGQQGFKVTDDSGTEYWFQQLEVSKSRSERERTGKFLYDRTSITNEEIRAINRSIILDYAPANSFTYRISSWYLTRIVNAAGTVQVDFLYETLPTFMRSLPSRVENIASIGSGGGDTYTYTYTATETKNVYLKQISCNGMTVTFNTSDRLDMMKNGEVSAQKLESIDFAFEGTVKKKVVFDYSYFDSGTGTPDYISKRLKLNSVQFQDEAGVKGGIYNFQYYDKGHLTLPDKDSYAQDLFGFYNGALNNDSRAHFLPLLPGNVRNIFPSGSEYCNREVNETYVTAGLLSRVFYPTGGNTTFIYESNDYSNAEELNYHVANYYLMNGNGGNTLLIPPIDVINDRTLTKGAGCRIKEVINYESGNKVASRKVYTYLSGGAESSGKLMFGMKHLRLDNSTPATYYTLSTQSMYADPSSATGSPLGYSKVQEMQYGANNQYNGYIEYTFENEVESNSSLFVLVNPDLCAFGHEGPRLFQYTTDLTTPYYERCNIIGGAFVHIRRDIFSPRVPNVVHASNGNNIEYAVYDKSSNLIYRKTNVYDELNEENVLNIVSHSFPRETIISSASNGIIFRERSVFKALRETTEYKDGVTTVTKYTYDPAFRHHKIQRTASTTSRNDEDWISYKYFTDYDLTSPVDQPSLGVRYLRDKHIYTPVEIIKGKRSTASESVTGASWFEYSYENGELKATYAAELENPVPSGTFTQSHVNSSGFFTADDSYSFKKRISSFNNIGLPNEIISEGGQRTSYIWDNTTASLLAEVSNASHADIAYTSFETTEKGNWQYGNVSREDETAPMGKRTCLLGEGTTITRRQLNSYKTYTVTYWSNNGPQNVNGTPAIEGRIVDGWQSFEHKVVNPELGVITVSGSGSIDELRLYPETATIRTSRVEPLIGVTDMMDANNMISYYSYDGLGRLTGIRDMNKNVLKQYAYNYKTSSVFDTYYSPSVSGTFTRNNCPQGYDGTSVTYTVPYGTYRSFISQEDASQQAWNDFTVNGRERANTQGICMYNTTLQLTYSNFTSIGFNIVYTNETGTSYNFTLNPNSYNNIVLGTIPRGIYTVYITPFEGSELREELYDMSVYNHYEYGVSSMSAEGVSLNCNCGHIEIADH